MSGYAILTAAAALAFIGVLVGIRVYYGRESVKHEQNSRENWWRYRKRDRDELLEEAQSTKFRARQRGESTWAYAHEYANWTREGSFEARRAMWSKPYEQMNTTARPLRMPRMSFARAMRQAREEALRKPYHVPVWSIPVTVWWSTRVDGVTHRLSMIQHEGGPSFMLRCDLDVTVPLACVDTHHVGDGPLLTCVVCFNMPRTQ